MLLGYGYMRNNLVRLGGYPTHRDVADMSYFFYFHFVFIYDQAEWRAYRDLAFRNEMNKNRYKHFSQPVKTKIMRMRIYKFKLTKR